MIENVLYVELTQHETCSDFLLSSLQNVSVFLNSNNIFFKGPLPGLRQFLETESSLKMMKNVFYFTLKTHFVLKIFKFQNLRFNFKIYDVITLETVKFGLLIETCPRFFSKKSKFNISLNQQSKILYSFSLLYVQVEYSQNILN